MRRRLVVGVLMAWLTAGCAIGTISPHGELTGFALGHAQLEHCTSVEWPGIPWAYPPEPSCNRIAGGALSVSGWEVLGTAASAVAIYFTGGAL